KTLHTLQVVISASSTVRAFATAHYLVTKANEAKASEVWFGMSSTSPGDEDDRNAAAARAYVLAEHRQSSDTRPARVLAKDKQVQLLMGQDVKKDADSLSSDEQQIREKIDQSVQQQQQQLSSHCPSSEIPLQNVNSASGNYLQRGWVFEDEEWHKCDRQLVNIVEVCPSSPEFEQDLDHKDAYKDEQHKKLRKNVASLGWSASLKAKGEMVDKPIAGAVGFGTSSVKEDGKSQDELQTIQFFSRSIVKFQAAAACSLNDRQLQLTEPAIEELQKIEAQILLRGEASQSVSQSTAAFFKKFGSHATCGIVHFGAASITSAVYQSEKKRSFEEVKWLANSKLHACLPVAFAAIFGVTASGERDRLQGDSVTESHHSEMSEVNIKTKEVGKITSSESETHLASDLAVIRVSDCKIGVWTLVRRCEEKFKDAKGLSRLLKSIWQSLTGLTEDPQTIDEDYEAIASAESFLKELCSQLTESQLTPHQWESQLKILCSKLQAIDDRTAPERKGMSWTGMPSLRRVFQSLLQVKDQFDDIEATSIKSHLKHMMHMAGNCDFPLRLEIAELICSDSIDPLKYSILSDSKVTSPEQLVNLMHDRVIPDVRNAIAQQTIGKGNILQVVRQDLTAAVRYLLEQMRENSNRSEMFVTSLVLGTYSFQLKEQAFDLLLTLEKLEQFTEALGDKIKFLKSLERSSESEFVQLSLLKLLIDSYGDSCNNANAMQLLSIYGQNSWTPEVQEAVESFQASGDWSKLSEAVNKMLGNFKSDGSRWRVELGEQRVRTMSNTSSTYEDAAADLLCLESLTNKQNEVLETLGLQDKFPGNISLGEVMELRDEQLEAQILVKDIKDLPLLMLKAVVMTNYKTFRSIVSEAQQALCNKKQLEPSGYGWSDDYDSEPESLHPTPDSSSNSVYDNPDVSDHAELLHSDVFLITFLCCDARLKQIVAEKLFDCKLAVPVACCFTPSLPLLFVWPLRSCVLKFRNTKDPCGRQSALKSLDSDTFDVVSVLRLGTNALSKSELINKCIHDKHEVFSATKKSQCERIMSDGSIEQTWILPDGDLEVPDAVCLLNLRGDALEWHRQRQLLAEVSNCVIVMLPGDYDSNQQQRQNIETALINVFENLSTKKFESKYRLLVVTDSAKTPSCLRNMAKKLGKESVQKMVAIVKCKTKEGSDVPIPDLTKELRSVLSEAIKSIKYPASDESIPRMSLNQLAERAKSQDWWVDELDSETRCIENQVKELMKMVSDIIEPKGVSEAKKVALPLHKNGWHEISRKMKEKLRGKRNLTGNQRVKWVDSIEEEVRELRQKQRLCIEKQQREGSFMMAFTAKASLASSRFQLFLLYMRQRFNSMSGKLIPRVLPNDDKIAARCDEDELEENSFGLEHVFRELSQVYEAIVSSESLSKQNQDFTSSLLSSAVQLLLHGHALELIDGEASSVAIDWIDAVLKKLDDTVDKKTLLVVSVLGVQSSGKSTLLNTMFGLQLPVSAGRCTRGAFMQLVKNNKDKSGLPVDFIVVIDTEGLRAPELGEGVKTRDNELATMAVGLADVTIMNIMGESVTDISDVLQIVVHAFLRMRMAFQKLRLDKTCLFVHQNVCAVDSAEKTQKAKVKLVETLDKTVETAAQEEGIDDVKKFTDIIAFDASKNVVFLSNLWEGKPPFAAVSPAYSRDVQETKQLILTVLQSFKDYNLSVSDLAVRIKDLWDAVCKEDFVFGFRNTLELRAYKEVEKKFRELKTRLEASTFQWLMDDGAKMLNSCTDSNALSQTLAQAEGEMHKFLDDKGKNTQTELESYFDQHSEDQLIFQWKLEKTQRLQRDVGVLKDETYDRLRDIKEEQRIMIESKGKLENCQQEIFTSAKKLAEELKGQDISDELLMKKFDELWEKLMSEISSTESFRCDFFSEAEKGLREIFSDQINLLDTEICQLNPTKTDEKRLEANAESLMRLEQVLSEHFSKQKSEHSDESNILSDDECREIVFANAKKIIREVDAHFELSNLAYRDERQLQGASFFKEIVSFVTTKVDEFNKNSSSTIKLKPQFKVFLSVHACKVSAGILRDAQRRYEQKHGVKTQLESFKPTAKQDFIGRFKNTSDDIISASYVIHQIKEAMKKTAVEHLRFRFLDFERFANRHIFILRKEYLLSIAMKSLIEGGKFPDFIELIDDPWLFTRNRMQEMIRKTAFNPDRRNHTSQTIETFLDKQVQRIVSAVKRAQSYCSREQRKSKMASNLLNIWLQSFRSMIVDSIPLPDFKTDSHCVRNINAFSSALSSQLQSLSHDVVAEIEERPELFSWCRRSDDFVPASLSQRPATCPFCGDICSDFDSSVFEISRQKSFKTKSFLESEIRDPEVCTGRRPAGVAGIVDSKNELALYTCADLVRSGGEFTCAKVRFKCHSEESENCERHKFSDYKNYFPELSCENFHDGPSDFWKWFMCKFKDQLAERHGAKMPDLPMSWRRISDQQAKRSIEFSDLDFGLA
ncbi:hypothetical protein BOX15_Mlig029572g1, partial [Macrostomum lignano]